MRHTKRMRNLKTFESFSYNGYAVNEGVWDAIKSWWKSMTSRRDDVGEAVEKARVAVFGLPDFANPIYNSLKSVDTTTLDESAKLMADQIDEKKNESKRFGRGSRINESVDAKRVGAALQIIGLPSIVVGPLVTALLGFIAAGKTQRGYYDPDVYNADGPFDFELPAGAKPITPEIEALVDWIYRTTAIAALVVFLCAVGLFIIGLIINRTAGGKFNVNDWFKHDEDDYLRDEQGRLIPNPGGTGARAYKQKGPYPGPY